MDLLDKYIIARWCYAIGEDFIDDMEYRYIEDKIRKWDPGNSYLNSSWSDDPCPIELLEKYDLMKYYRDIKFSHKSESIRSLISEEEVEQVYKSLNEEVRVSYKIDGFNIQVNYYNGAPISAETRGRTGNSLNARVVLQLVPKTIPIKGKVKVTGELSIPNDRWKVYRQETGNASQRSSVSTALAREDYDVLSFLAFKIQAEDVQIDGDMYTVLNSFGFKTPVFVKARNYEGLLKAIERMGKLYKSYNYLADGLVVDSNSSQIAVRIGEWKEEALRSYVTGYTENTGIYGDAIVVKISPVSLNGVTRSEVNVTNLQYIIDNKLEIGAPIAFNIRSAANAVLNGERTKDLQEEWIGRYEEYQSIIDGGLL